MLPQCCVGVNMQVKKEWKAVFIFLRVNAKSSTHIFPGTWVYTMHSKSCRKNGNKKCVKIRKKIDRWNSDINNLNQLLVKLKLRMHENKIRNCT